MCVSEVQVRLLLEELVQVTLSSDVIVSPRRVPEHTHLRGTAGWRTAVVKKLHTRDNFLFSSTNSCEKEVTRRYRPSYSVSVMSRCSRPRR